MYKLNGNNQNANVLSNCSSLSKHQIVGDQCLCKESKWEPFKPLSVCQQLTPIIPPPAVVMLTQLVLYWTDQHWWVWDTLWKWACISFTSNTLCIRESSPVENHALSARPLVWPILWKLYPWDLSFEKHKSCNVVCLSYLTLLDIGRPHR